MSEVNPAWPFTSICFVPEMEQNPVMDLSRQPTLEDVLARLRALRDRQGWARFHNAKDLAVALSVESAELLEHFLWASPEEVIHKVQTNRPAIVDEVADIAIYLLYLCDALGIDLLAAVEQKHAVNEQRAGQWPKAGTT